MKEKGSTALKSDEDLQFFGRAESRRMASELSQIEAIEKARSHIAGIPCLYLVWQVYSWVCPARNGPQTQV